MVEGVGGFYGVDEAEYAATDVDCDPFESSGFVIVEVEMLFKPSKYEFYDGAFPVDPFQMLWSMCFEVFVYSKNVAFAKPLVGWVWYRIFYFISFRCLSKTAAGVLAVSC